MADIDYLVVTAGSYDLMCEVVIQDDRDLLELTNRIRRVDGCRVDRDVHLPRPREADLRLGRPLTSPFPGPGCPTPTA